MTKFDTLIYLSICELGIKYYEKTNFSSFVSFVIYYNSHLYSNRISKSDNEFISNLINMLSVTYLLSDEEAGEYDGIFGILTPEFFII